MNNYEFHPRPRYYSDVDLERLAHEFAIENAQMQVLREGLERAARHWDEACNWPTTKMSLGEIKSIAQRFSKAAQDFQRELESIPQEVWESLSDASEAVNRGNYGPGIYKRAEKRPDGIMVQKLVIETVGSELASESSVEVDALVLTLSKISEIASVTPDILTDVTRGRKSNRPLQIWLSQIEPLWTRGLSRAFTRQFHKNNEIMEPVSNAARFAVEAYRCLTVDFQNSEIDTQMQNLIKEIRKFEKSGRIG